MALGTSDLVAAAMAEWAHWGRCSWNLVTGKASSGFGNDDDPTFAQYVIDTYLPPFYGPAAKWPTAKTIAGDDYFWSAVTISHFMLRAEFVRRFLPKAGVSGGTAAYADWVGASQPNEFPISEAHHDYIRWAVQARRDQVAGASYWAYRVDEAAAVPDVGDLVGHARGAKGMTKAKALGVFDKTGAYPSHIDLVVARRPGEIDVIGGNVRDSVCLKTLKTDANGLLADTNFNWFVVLKKR